MKKKLEAELISIAHRILKLKNKSDVIALHQETQKLYEKLSILRFVEESYGEVKPTIGTIDIESQLEDYFDKEPETNSETPTNAEKETPFEVDAQSEKVAAVDEADETDEAPEENHITAESDDAEINQYDADSDTIEPETTEIPDVAASSDDHDNMEAEEELEKETEVEAEPETEIEVAPESQKEEHFTPSFELSFDRKSDEADESKPETPLSPQFSFDDLLGKDYADPVFVKPDEVRTEKKFSDYTYKDAETIKSESRSLNDRLSKGITIGLNDRIAFIKHLFADSSEDYNRVLSQLMTFDTYDEAKGFIDDMVKPDYNDWEGKDEYAERFMDIVEKRFN